MLRFPTQLVPASYFTLFSSLHSFAIGLLPFFLPALIWQQTQQLATLTEFVSWTGAGYALTLVIWHKLFSLRYWKLLICLSFVFELLLIYLALFQLDNLNLALLGLLNGIFNCCYWMVQRVLFDKISNQSNSGRLFGNLQLYLGFSLKVGILIGGYFMQSQPWLILLLASLAAFIFLISNLNNLPLQTLLYQPKEQQPIKPSENATVTTTLSWREKLIFIIDGPFLYLESYLWILSIFNLTNNSTERFSITIIALSLTLGVIFYFVKNMIDKQEQQRLYLFTIVLYALSWFVRGAVNSEWNGFAISLTLLAISFATALFRLYFNKRFYDRAKQQQSYSYILNKSAYSQASICIFFAGLTLALQTNANFSASDVYWLMIPFVGVYALYLQNKSLAVKQIFTANDGS